MTKFKVSQLKENELLRRMEELEISEDDIEESFISGSGKGGQKINKTSSCVRLVHRPSGFEIKCQQARSQSLNRYIARRLLCDRIEERVKGKMSAEQQRIEKIRRQKRRRSRRQKEILVANKRVAGAQKVLRRSISSDSSDD